ncbi:hypothetical protein M441DRAFT_44558 [Trichoderma asperellum CBS 433.97]|uniref:Uncharacterized protein n=1 Tax=Trichoderma asperellum (strain ATCC 204424 / CBS 433.97 / NBRC 101777) TaxID=1042311 RepID=A0A2T3ZI62_TRIA4|nr:hypothetical protein M441DRAFT_44558 [Trichoderma asperellum CBS 433.97]PTB44504.1 hypothetical protein M441DRAFT_44558 [Trichoderma asperellum CBS 433.97]
MIQGQLTNGRLSRHFCVTYRFIPIERTNDLIHRVGARAIKFWLFEKFSRRRQAEDACKWADARKRRRKGHAVEMPSPHDSPHVSHDLSWNRGNDVTSAMHFEKMLVELALLNGLIYWQPLMEIYLATCAAVRCAVWVALRRLSLSHGLGLPKPPTWAAVADSLFLCQKPWSLIAYTA